ncbi:MAG: YdiU family protein, partial [Geminicoccaceae bacterium]|nr:YdiU family protein [Geminicoccaceae bacterium]
SRGGDGKAVLSAVLREFLISEAMAALGIPTTRTLSAVLTGERVMREGYQPGAVLARVAASHVRVGTFQYFYARRDREALQALLAAQAPYDILISAATGGGRAAGPFLEMDMDGYRASFDKLWGYAHVIRYGTQHLAKDGAIVVVSGSPARKSLPGQVALSSVGGAVEALVRAVAKEIAPRRINVVSPGFIDTPMVPKDTPNRDEVYRQRTANNLIPRAGTADEVAQAILFVVQNDFVTGTTVDVDGGWLLS